MNSPFEVSRLVRAAGLSIGLLSLVAAPALAHEERDVAGYSLEVGFVAEPVFVGDRSGMELYVHKGEEAVEGLDQTLKAEVIFSGQKRDLPLAAREEDPGAYESVFIPTAAGPYTFHIFGTIEGSAVDESFTSSPTGFNEVQEAAAGQFPVRIATPAELEASAKKGADAAGQLPIALVLGGAGLVVGLLGLGLGLASRRRAA